HLSPALTIAPRPQPNSPVFPYTTLFRSEQAGVRTLVDLPGVGENLAEHLVIALPQRLKDAASHNARLRGPALINETMRYWLTGTDRKSTRLNSSHVKISYAVFCLRKITR